MPKSPVDEAFESYSGASPRSAGNSGEGPRVDDEALDALESLEEAPALLEEPDEEFFDALETLDTELFRVGDMQMSRADIGKTIEIIEAMESVLITELDRLLTEENHPRGVPPARGQRRGFMQVPAPGRGRRSVGMRSPRDSVNSVKDRFFTRKAAGQLLHLVQALPKVTTGDGSKKTMSEFKKEVLRVLAEPTVEVYKVRALLPIKESGSLKASDADRSQKPAPEYERVTSNMLKEKARELGVLE